MSSISRREFLRVSTVVVAGGVLTACSATPTTAPADTVAPVVPTATSAPTDTVAPNMPTSTPAPTATTAPTATAAPIPTATPRPFPLGTVPRERILNYFDGRHSNGFAEGINLKIKLLNRQAFGYRNFDNFRLHLLMAFGR